MEFNKYDYDIIKSLMYPYDFIRGIVSYKIKLEQLETYLINKLKITKEEKFMLEQIQFEIILINNRVLYDVHTPNINHLWTYYNIAKVEKTTINSLYDKELICENIPLVIDNTIRLVIESVNFPFASRHPCSLSYRIEDGVVKNGDFRIDDFLNFIKYDNFIKK